jgi:hypothetical protein
MRGIALAPFLPTAPAVFVTNVFGQIATSADGLAISCGRRCVVGCLMQCCAAEARPSRVAVLVGSGDRGDDVGLGRVLGHCEKLDSFFVSIFFLLLLWGVYKPLVPSLAMSNRSPPWGCASDMLSGFFD